ncbi:hypothetical protein [Teredinibacter purpureus]|uniref:hypothetical protein n=1 Tax=Teredinibacter purpureus TaxID=2731756 RepID=UPI0005F89460|nr:hypothetical protein [Teredinibacter purpureus]
MIDIPKVWLKFGLCIYQDFFSEHADFHEGILFALEGLSSSEKEMLMSFIRHVLNESPSNQDLINLWGKSGASDTLVSNQMNVIYEAMLEIIKLSANIESGKI